MKDFLSEERESAVIIPAYMPDENFPTYVSELEKSGVSEIVVVDDGSGKEKEEIFRRVSALPKVVLLRHTENRGKGEALKTAFRYAISRFSRGAVLATADADGQHTVPDVLRVLRAVRRDDTLYLGTRSFSGKGIPWRSRFGNVTTRKFFLWAHGIRLTDTQTGLRGFSSSLLPLFASVEGSRFEYEMNVLLLCKGEEIRFHEVPISTVYGTKDEHRSHFRPIRDSLMVTRAVLGRPVLFLLSAAVAAGIDLVLFLALRQYLSVSSLIRIPPAYLTAVAKGAARIGSSTVNVYFNFRHVFRGSERGAVFRYYVLWTLQLALSTLGTSFLLDTLLLPAFLAAALTDMTLGVASYFVQKKWVFRKKKNAANDF